MMNGDAINVPRVQKRDRRRSLFLVKRSAAFYQGGKYKECECDLKIASMLMPNDQGLQNDLARVQKLL